ncbi:MAG: hypothetical protein QOG73_1794, partial [Acetobacteraceae bacterium]|nr:hypothetical protein [Acetobacteraceae bacterium]
MNGKNAEAETRQYNGSLLFAKRLIRG